MQCGSEWAPLVAETISSKEIEALLSRAVPYVHVPQFLDPGWCEEVVLRFHAMIDELPDHQSLAMGPAIFDTLTKPVEMFVDSPDPAEYFKHVAEDAPRVRALFAGGDDPLEKMRRCWREAGWSEVPAAEDEHRRYHPDAVWGLRRAEAPPHVDLYERERHIALSRFGRHINYNVYIQSPDSGGGFAVYRRYADEEPGGSFQTVLEAVSLHGNERIEHRPEPGDLVIFDAMLYHEVMRVDGAQRARIQAHSNVLVDPASRECLFYA